MSSQLFQDIRDFWVIFELNTYVSNGHQAKVQGELKTHLVEHRLGFFSFRKGKLGLLLIILIRQAVDLPQNRMFLEKVSVKFMSYPH